MEDIRITIDQKYKEIYNDLHSFKVTLEDHELFYICVCLGYLQNKRTPISKRLDKFWGKTITPSEIACYKSMVINENESINYALLGQDKKIFDIIQEFANTGIEILMDECLNTYLVDYEDGLKRIDPIYRDSLPLFVLSYIFEKVNSTGA